MESSSRDFLNYGAEYRYALKNNQNTYSKNKTPFRGMLYTCFGCETKTGVVRTLVNFQEAHVQPHHLKVLGESFPLMGLNIGLC